MVKKHVKPVFKLMGKGKIGCTYINKGVVKEWGEIVWMHEIDLGSSE